MRLAEVASRAFSTVAGLEAVWPIRDDIEERVRRLLADLNVAVTAR